MTRPTLDILTHCAHWGYDEHLYFDYPVFGELTGQETLTGLLALSVLGRRITREECGVLDDAAAAATLADPRIWPLKLTRLVASYGSTGPAVAAGLLILEEARIGPWATAKAATTLFELHGDLDGRQADAEYVDAVVHAFLERHRLVWGFGTPFRDHDERLVAFRQCMQRRERDQLPYWRSMEAIVGSVRKMRHIEPNMSLASAAALLDMGMSLSQIGPLSLSLMFHMFLANGAEGAQQAQASLRQLPDECVSYVGRAPRSSPRLDRWREQHTGRDP